MKEIDNNERIILGSGDLFMVEFTGEIPDDAAIEVDDNRAGNIKGGATLEYSQTTQTVKDDQGRVNKTILTGEDVKMKTGMITWVKEWMQMVMSTARVDETTKANHVIYKIGGLKNRNKKKSLFRFVHTREDGTKLRVTLTGKNTGTVSLAFTNENPTQVDAEITAGNLDSDGTLVIIDDEKPASAGNTGNTNQTNQTGEE